MDETPQFAVDAASGLGSVTRVISEPSPASWKPHFALAFPRALGGGPASVTLIALILPLLLIWVGFKYKKMQEENQKPFPFLQLPQELRDMVYENLVEDPAYPPPPTCTKHTSTMDWMLPGRWSPSSSAQHRKSSNWILLANKQIHNEYMKLLCKRATFHLTVSPHNYQNPCSSPTSTTPSDQPIWNISPQTLKSLRSCDLKLITTSSMLGVSDPRNMSSSDWTLAHQIRQELTALTNVSNLTLDAKAIGDPLWNPLWIWYHASQSFKTMGTPAADTVPMGPKLQRITFSLDTWSPGENHLQRDPHNRGAWTWFCMKGHNVGIDGGHDMTVREFCGKLYQECRVCRPDLDSEDEDEE